MGNLETEKDGKYINHKIKSEPGNYLEYYNGIYKSIREGKPLGVTPDQALMNISAIELAYKSSKEKKAFEFNT